MMSDYSAMMMTIITAAVDSRLIQIISDVHTLYYSDSLASHELGSVQELNTTPKLDSHCTAVSADSIG